jgi:cysteine synthase A
MFRQSVRRFATTAVRAAAEGSTAYATRVSTAQGVVNGLTEGMSTSEITIEL